MYPKVPQSLPTANPDEILPTISRWSKASSIILIGIFIGAIALAATLKYKVTIKAPIIVRPEGELRLVEAGIEGTVERIEVKNNQQVQQGEIIAYLKEQQLRYTEQNLQANLEKIKQQLEQIQLQLVALKTQIKAETLANERTIAAATSRWHLLEQEYLEKQTVTQADVREAQAAKRLAEEELSLYQQLEGTGAIAKRQLKEKEAALEIAVARLQRAEALVNPSKSAVKEAQQEIAKTQALGESNLAELKQEQELLLRQQTDLEKQRQSAQHSLQQMQLNLNKLTIRSPISGTIQELSLRNQGQVVELGEVVAQIIPQQAPLIIKAQLNQNAISQVKVGQGTTMRIDSCIYT
ncbi:MAG: HlyD family efflux transporter periplasmic adaptor subunit, partial [Symploca sp. SIO1A3]|nr:HlyD family efflux transporter periplasmic adaptor subunit [Symploca sp. SIO1A3]